MGEKSLISLGLGAAILGILAVFVVVGCAVMLPTLIVWLLWNHAIAPAFGIHHIGFWLTFAILWVLSILGRTLFGK
jgi:hypothetical protein